MALDLRRPYDRGCRTWLERVLLSLEERGVLEATYERRPPHYHVAVYPTLYKSYVERLESGQKTQHHRVDRGDTLWQIAARYNTTVAEVRRHNDLRSDKIYPGQILEVPISR